MTSPRLTRRLMISAVAAAAALSITSCNSSGTGSTVEGDMVQGDANAPVTVIEYASVTCSVCGAWHTQVYPEFKAQYIDTGKVRYVFREFPTPPFDIAAAGFLLARCAGEDRYFQIIDAIMHSQQEWQQGTPPRQSLLRIAQSAGFSQEQFNACVTDENSVRALEERIQLGRRDGVTGTPTFFVNGRQISDPTLEGLSAAIDPLLPAS